MTDMDKFAEEVLAAVKEKDAGAFHAKIVMAEKNNGITLTGIAGAMEGDAGGPCVYLNEYFEEYKNGWMEVKEAAEDVYRKILKYKDGLKDIDTDNFMKWEWAEPRIQAKLINMERNKEMLTGMPWKQFLDLAVVYYVKISGVTDGGEACFLVKNSSMEIWGQDEESLYQTAMANMHKDGGPVFESMEAVLQGTAADDMVPFMPEEPELGMYVLSNRSRLLGAAEILDRDTLKMISGKMGGDFIVLPSSLHESIILPSDAKFTYTELAAMVREINMVQVDREERLSNHIYLYEKDKGVLRIAA